jgi:hypothetical protein
MNCFAKRNELFPDRDDIHLDQDDILQIKIKLAYLPPHERPALLAAYLKYYDEALEKIPESNYASTCLARHEATNKIKKWRITNERAS